MLEYMTAERAVMLVKKVTCFGEFEENISPHILLRKNCCDLNLSDSLPEGLCIFTFFLFPDSELYLLNGFDFYVDLF